MKVPITTIQVSRENRDRLASMAAYGESLNDVLDRLLEPETISLSYSDALKYFWDDVDTLDSLQELDEDERANFVLQVEMDHAARTAIYRMGHARRDTKHLGKLGEGRNNTSDAEDDYEGAKRALREIFTSS